jgi:predicted DNA-binding protein
MIHNQINPEKIMNRLKTDELNEEPTELEQTVALISKTAQQEERGVAKSLSVRMPYTVYSTLKAMADHSGQSINKIAVQILRVGIDAVSDELPADDANAIAEIRSALFKEMAEAAIAGNTVEQLGDE